MAYLYKVASMDDFDDYLKIKSDPAAILWSGFSSAPDPMKLRVHFQYLLDNCFSKGDVLFILKIVKIIILWDMISCQKLTMKQ